MGKDVTLSKKHGLNSSMVVCPICGKAKSVALLGHIKGDEEAPRYIQGDICDECKARVADNKCFVISVSEDRRLKRYVIVSKDIFTQKVEDCAVLMKEADFNAVFDKH
jgi:formate dehydrogenase maturation protein FdhE